jgi:hypothetical protein
VAAEVVSSMAATVGGSHSKGRSRVGERGREACLMNNTGGSSGGERLLPAASRNRGGMLAWDTGRWVAVPGRLPARGLERWSRQRVARPRTKGRPRRQAGRRRRGARRDVGGAAPGSGGRAGAAALGATDAHRRERRPRGGRRAGEMGGRPAAGGGWERSRRLEPAAGRRPVGWNRRLREKKN